MSRADETAPSPLPQARPAFRLDPIGVLLGLAPAGFVAWRLLLPERPATDTGPRALADAAFALTFWAYLLVVGSGVGYTVLRLVRFESDSAADHLRFGIPIGLALLGFIPFFLGLAGFLYPGPLMAALGLAGLLVGPAARLAVGDFLSLLRGLARLERSPRNWLLAAVYAVLAFSALALALSPPTGYDDLWYHLEGPRLFLRAGRVYPEPHNWPANYVFLVDMLYVFPLALRNDTVPRLLHAVFAVIVLTSGYSLGRVYVPALAWVIPAAMLTMGQLPSLATQAGTDFAVASFELLGLEQVVRHIRDGRPLNLPLLGLCLGLGLATKATSAAGAAAIAGVLAVYLGGRMVRAGFRAVPFTPGELLAGLAVGLAVVLPWYVKNWLWFGHPLFPYAGEAADAETRLRMQLLIDYVTNGYGLPRTLPDLLSLPVATFADPVRFGLAAPPAALVVLAPFALFLGRRPPTELLGFVGLRIGIWVFSSQQMRFLVSALVVAAVLLVTALGRANPPRVRRILGEGAVWAAFVLAAYIALIYGRVTLSLQMWSVIAGFESKEGYLTRVLPGFQALRFMGGLPPESRVLLVGDARHYYCPPTCWPEADQFTWTRLAMLADFDPERLVGDLRAMGITHILVSRPDVVFLSSHDPGGWFGRSVKFLYEELGPRCLSAVFVDRASEVYELTCPR